MATAPFNDSSRYMYWDSLHFIPPEQKTKKWMAEAILFCKRNAKPLIEPEKAKLMRDLSNGEINASDYKKIIDPVMPDGSGGTAEYFSADWKANPIFLHLDNIVETNIEKIPRNLYVKAADEFAQTKMQKENNKIMERKTFTKFINEMNAKIGLPPISNKDDPYRYVDQMNAPKAKSNGKKGAAPITMIDSIKAAIEDSEDLALFNEYIYKDGVEIAIELGMDHYLTENKYDLIGAKTVEDIRNFNACVQRFYTSKTTGKPVIEHMDVDLVHVSPHKKNDLSDIVFWLIEYDVTFSEFIRMFGAKIKEECEADGRKYDEVLKEIFELNRASVTNQPIQWDRCSRGQRDGTKIRIGYFEMETQDYEVYSDRTIRGNNRFKKMPSDYTVSKDQKSRYNASREERHYNCWYKAYYIPLRSSDTMIQTSDFAEQSKYIFDFGKVQDQQRFGDDLRYSKASLYGWKSNRMSFAEVTHRFMPKINLLWFHFQNNLSNVMPHGISFAEELITLMMDASDDANKQGKDSKFEMIRRLKQTGYGMFKMMNDQGQIINDGKPFAEVKTGHLNSALENLRVMQELYNIMTQALGISDVREGLDPRPRTSLGAIQLAYSASNNATHYIEKAYMDTTVEAGKRLMYYFGDIVREQDTLRLQEFYDIVGAANAMALEAIKDIPEHRLGLNIKNIMTDQEKQRLMFLAERMVQSGQIDPDVMLFIARVDNLKYAEAILRLKYKAKQRELMANETKKHAQQMEILDMQLQVELMKDKAAAENEAQVWNVIKGWDERIKELELAYKSQNQSQLLAQRGDNRKEQELLKHELVKERELEKPLQ